MRSVIADAVQQRQTDTSGCGTGDKAAERAAQDALLNGFRTKEEMDEANEIAIQEATFELMELEEERKLGGGPGPYSAPQPSPPIEGLTWSPEQGLQPVRSSLQPSAPPSPPPTRLPVPPPSINSQEPPPPLPLQRPIQPPPIPMHSRPEINSHGGPISRLVKEAENKGKNKLKKPLTASSSSISLPELHQTSTSDEAWQCLTCTLINIASATQCDACESPKPGNIKSSSSAITNGKTLRNASTTSSKLLGWKCLTCGTFMENQWWTCSLCGAMKASS